MIIVLGMLAIVLAIGAATLAETLASRSYASHDARGNRALQAADAGIAAVLYQQNELPLKQLEFNGGPLGASTLLDCVVPALSLTLQVTSVADAAVNAAGVCPDSSGPGAPGSGSANFPAGDHAYYEARFIPGATSNGNHIALSPKIVADGYDDNGNSTDTSGYVVRRVEAILAPVDPFQAIEASGNLTMSGLEVLGLPVTSALNGNARANGSVQLPTIFLNTNLSGGLIGSVTWGTSYSGPLIALSNVSQETTSFTRSPISISPSKANCPTADATIPRQANCADLGAAYKVGTDSISMSSGTLTFPPGDYVFCNFNVTGGTVMANSTATAPVRIFIDSSTSSRCSGDGLGSAQGNFVATPGLGNLLGNVVGVTGATGLQIYVVGDHAASPYDNATAVTIGGADVVQNYVVYAPTSKVNVSNCLVSFNLLGLETDVCAAIQGAVIGDDVTVKASVFTQDLDLSSYPLYSGLGAFHVQQYVECSPVYPLGSNPASGC